MILLLSLCLIATAANAQFNNQGQYSDVGAFKNEMESDAAMFGLRKRVARTQDGAEYDDKGNRVHEKVYSYRPEHQKEEKPLMRSRRQNKPRFQRLGDKRQLRPVLQSAERLQRVQRPDERAPGLPQQRELRPVNRPKEVFSSLRLNSDGPQRFALAGQTFGPYQREAQSIIGNRRFELPGKPTQLEFEAPAKPESQATNKEQRFSSNLEQETRRSDSNVAERFYNSKEQDKVYERSAQQDTGSDLLEGESFQPAYTPYSPPAAAYDAGYAPPEQKSIQDAVAAGAAAYNGAAYEEPKRLSFQIHGQEGPNSYRFGYDTGEGYNRQFRYEERDNYGVLHGRYGYYDQEGKLQIVNYTADPEAGFHAEGDHVPKPEY